ncbi:MAG: ABC transporter permease, partial [Paraburkholderia hospita]
MNSRIPSRMNQTMTTPTVVEVAPEVKPPTLRARLSRNPEWFTVALIAATCL